MVMHFVLCISYIYQSDIFLMHSCIDFGLRCLHETRSSLTHAASLQEVQRERRQSLDVSHSNVVTLGNQRQRNGGSDQGHSVQKHSQQQVPLHVPCPLCPLHSICAVVVVRAVMYARRYAL